MSNMKKVAAIAHHTTGYRTIIKELSYEFNATFPEKVWKAAASEAISRAYRFAWEDCDHAAAEEVVMDILKELLED